MYYRDCAENLLLVFLALLDHFLAESLFIAKERETMPQGDAKTELIDDKRIEGYI